MKKDRIRSLCDDRQSQLKSGLKALGFSFALLGVQTGFCAELTNEASADRETHSGALEKQVANEGAPTNRVNILRATYRARELDRFQPLPPRSKLASPDLESEQGQAQFDAARAREAERERKRLEKIATDRFVAETWLSTQEQQANNHPKMLKALKTARASLLPDDATMKKRMQQWLKRHPDKTLDAEILDNPERLDAEYRTAFKEELTKLIETFNQETEGAAK